MKSFSLKVIQGGIFAGLMCAATLASADTTVDCPYFLARDYSQVKNQINASGYSKNGVFLNPITQLIFQPQDGNLVVYGNATGSTKALWATHTENKGATHAVFQCDGNLVVYSGNTPLWAASWDKEHFNFGGNVLSVQSDGNLVIYNKNYLPRRVMWATMKLQ